MVAERNRRAIKADRSRCPAKLSGEMGRGTARKI